MPKKEKEEILKNKKFIRYFHEIEKRVGISRIIKKLDELRDSEEGNYHKIIKNKILEEIANIYGISPKILLKTTKRGNATQARVMAIILFNKHLRLGKSELSELLGHSQPNIVSLRLEAFTALRRGKKLQEGMRRFEKVYSLDFMKKYAHVDARVTEFINSSTEPLTDWKKW
jgi:hypothetical protein